MIGWLKRKRAVEDTTEDEGPVVCLYKQCGHVFATPPAWYPTRKEFERETGPAMAMVRAIEVVEAHKAHG